MPLLSAAPIRLETQVPWPNVSAVDGSLPRMSQPGTTCVRSGIGFSPVSTTAMIVFGSPVVTVQRSDARVAFAPHWSGKAGSFGSAASARRPEGERRQ